MKKYTFINHEYELTEDVKEAFDNDLLNEKITDYYENYDYIVGDWAYGKLRLKGFTDEKNPIHNNINDYKLVTNYIKNNCAYGCRYFILKKIKD